MPRSTFRLDDNTLPKRHHHSQLEFAVSACGCLPVGCWWHLTRSTSFSTFIDTFPFFVKGHSTYWPEDLDYRSDKSGRVVLVGEAAHTWFVST